MLSTACSITQPLKFGSTWLYTLPSASVPTVLPCVQVAGPFSPVAGLWVNALAADMTPERLNGSLTGLVNGEEVTVQLMSTVLTNVSGSPSRLTHLQLQASSGAGLLDLLAAQSGEVTAELGIDLSNSSASGSSSSSSSSSRSTAAFAELVLDSTGLRLLNISLGGARLGLGALAARLGLDWQSAAGGDPVSFSSPCLYYVPKKPTAPLMEWSGHVLEPAGMLAVSAYVDVPSLGVNSSAAMLRFNGSSGGRFNLQVCSELHDKVSGSQCLHQQAVTSAGAASGCAESCEGGQRLIEAAAAYGTHCLPLQMDAAESIHAADQKELNTTTAAWPGMIPSGPTQPCTRHLAVHAKLATRPAHCSRNNTTNTKCWVPCRCLAPSHCCLP